MKNAFKIFGFKSETTEDGETYSYLAEHENAQLAEKEFANETEALQHIADSKAKGEKFEGDFVILNVKTF